MKAFQNISIKWKTALPLSILVIIGIVVTILVTGVKTRDIVLDEIQSSTLPGYRDTVLNALTTMMISGNFTQAKGPFLDQMKHIADIRVIRASILDSQYPEGRTNYKPTENENAVLQSGAEKVFVEKANMVGIFPYVARADVMGKNCLSCHSVPDGTVLGAVSIRIPLASSLKRIRSMQYLYTFFGVMGILALVGTVIIVFRFTHRPLLELINNTKQLVSQNIQLSEDATGNQDEVKVMSSVMRELLGFLNRTLNKVIAATGNITSTVDILRVMAERTTEGAQTQTRQATSIAAVAEQMSRTILDIARNSSESSAKSQEAMESAREGKQIADESIEKVNNFYSSTVQLAGTVERLNKRVSEIGDVVTVIKDIADQTNLLALNAAIEAARAGEQGRGFAVVADEVRKLAERTIKATDDVSGKISSVQAESVETAKSMDMASSDLTSTIKYIRKVDDVLNKILADVSMVNDQVTQIATAVEEQSSAAEDVASNIESTSDIASEIERMAKDVLTEVARVTGVVDELRDATAEFRLAKCEAVSIELVKADHKVWVERVGTHITGGIRLDPALIGNEKLCRLGKWYFGEGAIQWSDLASYKAMAPAHKDLHKLGQEAILLHDSGDRAGAQNAFNRMKETSVQILKYLDDIKRECEEQAAEE